MRRTADVQQKVRTPHKAVGELRRKATQIAAPKLDLDAQAEKRRFWITFFERNFKGKIISAKMGKICWQSTIRNLHAAATVRFDSQLRKTITHQAATARNLAPTIHCDLHRLNCKTQTHSTNKEEKSPGTQLHLRTQIEPTSTAKRRCRSP